MLLGRVLATVATVLRLPRAGKAAVAELAQAVDLVRLARYAEAERILVGRLRANPLDDTARHLLGFAVLAQDRPSEALVHLDAISSEAGAEVWFTRAETLLRMERAAEAFAAYDVLRRRFPDFAPGHAGYGTLLSNLERWDDAVAALRRANELAPGSAVILNNLGHALKEVGDIRGALEAYSRALEVDPNMVLARHARLFLLHYLPEVTPGQLFAAYREFNGRHALPLAASAPCYANQPDPDKVLNIGYVSGDFKRHPVGYFIQPVVERHDRSQVRVFCYSTRNKRDDLTEKIAASADAWREVERLDDADFAGVVKRDTIDILVDLSGHTRGGRLLAFARKPAPVQATWMGYLDTTGLDAVDYIISDPWVVPSRAPRQQFSEEPLILPRCFQCYRPPGYAPPVSPPPAVRKGYPTFGCFNNIAKVNESVIELWAAVMHATPAARLLLKTTGLARGSSRDWLGSRF